MTFPVRDRRVALGYSLRDLAEAVGITPRMMTTIESRRSSEGLGLYPDQVHRLAKTLGCEPVQLDPSYYDPAKRAVKVVRKPQRSVRSDNDWRASRRPRVTVR